MGLLWAHSRQPGPVAGGPVQWPWLSREVVSEEVHGPAGAGPAVQG